MIKRIVEISGPARLCLNKGQMVIERQGLDPETVPVEDIGVLILDHQSISHTQGLFTACIEQNAAVLVCDAWHLPAAMFLPFAANSLHSRVVAIQSSVPEPVRKRLWKGIVRAKIEGQAEALKLAGKDPCPVLTFAARVRPGDPDNIEAQAARVYWQRLFGPDFRRDHEKKGVNSLLNYGYAVVRGRWPALAYIPLSAYTIIISTTVFVSPMTLWSHSGPLLTLWRMPLSKLKRKRQTSIRITAGSSSKF